jgi:Predicted carbamoyl transferase, NodU family
MVILGISCFYHDAAAAIIKDGILVSAVEEERFSRKKHDSGFPTNAIKYCLESVGVSVNDLDYLVFYEKPFSKFERILKTCITTFPMSSRLFSESMASWLGRSFG